MQHPNITVLIPAYNRADYIGEAVDSILNQTYKDFELLIIDDGSTDNTKEVVNSYSDTRIRVLSNGVNKGLVKTLNRGISEARGTYIARMDADDISAPTRLEKQVGFLESTPEVGVVGTWRKTFGAEQNVYHYFTNHEHIRANLLFAPSLVHPSVMMRTSLFTHNNLTYDSQYTHVEDYALWCKAAEITRFANIPKVLLYHRIHGNRVSSTHSQTQKTGGYELRCSQIKKLGISPSEYELALHTRFTPPENISTNKFLGEVEYWFQKLLECNTYANTFTHDALFDVLAKRWFQVCNANARGNWQTWRIYNRSPFSAPIHEVKQLQKAKMLLKTLL